MGIAVSTIGVAILCLSLSAGDMVLPGMLPPELSLFESIDSHISPESADGYMFDYAVNLQTLNYLQLTNVLTREDRERSLEFMQSSKRSFASISFAFVIPCPSCLSLQFS